MIKQYLLKRKKIALGILNTHIRKKGKIYDDSNWWDTSFYLEGVTDRQTISKNKSIITSNYHYASVEMQILKHFQNNNIYTKGSNILDLGSGSGHWINFYKNLGVGSIKGIDVSNKSFKYLVQKQSGDTNVEIHRGKALEVIRNLDGPFDIVNAVGVMFHIVDDTEWKNTIVSIANALKNDGLFIIGGHFGFLDGLNVQIDKNGINKRLRSKKRWVNNLKASSFRRIKIYRNNAYLWINDTLPENNVLIATK